MFLLEQFKHLTLHPKNAARLKELVLQLAVQGKLTESWRNQNPHVEPASELLKRIEAEKAQLVKEKKIKKEQPLEEIQVEELICDLPESWLWVRLGELGDWGAGATPSRGNSELYDGNINWYKSGELNNGIIDYNSEERITELALKKTSLRLNKPGDVLIAMYGATIGKTAILAVEGTTNQAVCACTCYSGLSNLYLHLLLKAYKSVFTQQGTGGAQPNISRVKIRTTPVPLPPLAEQEAIVARVEELMQKIEELEKANQERIQLQKSLGVTALHALTSAPGHELEQQWAFLKQHFQTIFGQAANVKKLRETILQLAVQGKLTSAWRRKNSTTQPAADLLQQIQAEKAQLVKEKKIKKEKSLEPISKDEVPYELPESWVWCRFGEVLLDIEAGVSPSCEPQKATLEEWGVIKISAVSWGMFLPEENKKLPLSIEPFIDKEIHAGDFIMSRANTADLIARSVVVNDSVRAKLLLNDKTLRVSFLQDEVKVYSNIFNSCSVARGYYKKAATGTSDSMKNISREQIKLLPFPLPPLAEQVAIVIKIDQLMQLCDELEQQLTQVNQQTEALMQAVVQEALQPQEELEPVD